MFVASLAGLTMAVSAVSAESAVATPTATAGSASSATYAKPASPLRALPRTNRLLNPTSGLPLGVTPTRQTVQRATTSSRPAVRKSASTRSTLLAPPTPHLNYYGGPVVSNAQIISVLWGAGSYLPEVSGAAAAPNMDSFTAGLANSSHLAWINGEYRTTVAGGTNQLIGPASFLGRTQITPTGPGTTGATVNNSAIRDEIIAQLNAGHLPLSFDATGHTNTVYALYFPAGTKVCDDSTTPAACSPDPSSLLTGGFCGMHDTIRVSNGVEERSLLYMILPDLSSTAAQQGCGSALASTPFTVTQSVASHEILETITDPEVGLATTFASPLAWYDPNNNYAEIADVCQVWTQNDGTNELNGNTTGTDGRSYVVSKEWSNRLGQCIVDQSADTVKPTAALTAPPALFQAGTRITVGMAGSDTGGSGLDGYDVQYTYANWNSGFVRWSMLATDTRSASVAFNARPGRQYCFHVRARDFAGNISAWSPNRCTTIPLDDRALTPTSGGWSRISSSDAYGRTLTRTTTPGATLRLSGAQAARLGIVVTTCSSCGVVGVYVNGRLWRNFNTVSRTTRNRVILLPATFRLRSATIVLRNQSRGRQLLIDGLGVARS